MRPSVRLGASASDHPWDPTARRRLGAKRVIVPLDAIWQLGAGA